ncbi:hypothetical protein J6590_025859 [Homalodisca vitripennis]|nr:hypothetical protein J6590_025859 [Homalodisca vitripennis]
MSTYMCHTQSVCRIPKAIQPTRRGKTSLSLQARPCSMPKKDTASLRSKLLTARSQSPKPNTPDATSRKNPYSNVKAKVDSKLKTKSTTKLQSQFSPTCVHYSKSNISSVASSKIHSYAGTVHEQSDDEKPSNNEELLEKQKQLLTIFNDLKKAQPKRDLQQLEKEICRLVRKKTITGAEEGGSLSNPPLLSEGMI